MKQRALIVHQNHTQQNYTLFSYMSKISFRLLELFAIKSVKCYFFIHR